MEKAKRVALIILEAMVVSAIVIFVGGMTLGILFGAALAAGYDSIGRKLEDEFEISYLYFWGRFKKLVVKVTPIWVPLYLFYGLFIVSMLSVPEIGPMWPYWLALQSVVLAILIIMTVYFLAIVGRYDITRKEALFEAYKMTFKYIYVNWLIVAVVIITGLAMIKLFSGLFIIILSINIYCQTVLTQAIFIRGKYDKKLKRFVLGTKPAAYNKKKK